jgi:hypothetical protein
MPKALGRLNSESRGMRNHNTGRHVVINKPLIATGLLP